MNREEKVNSMIIGQRIKYARKSMNLTQEELGRLMCTDGKYISRLESGKSLPSLKRLVQLSRALKCTCDYFLWDMDVLETGSEDVDIEFDVNNAVDVMLSVYDSISSGM